MMNWQLLLNNMLNNVFLSTTATGKASHQHFLQLERTLQQPVLVMLIIKLSFRPGLMKNKTMHLATIHAQLEQYVDTTHRYVEQQFVKSNYWHFRLCGPPVPILGVVLLDVLTFRNLCQ